MKKILLLYTSLLGRGHQRSAEAIENALKLKYKKVNVVRRDVLESSSKFVKFMTKEIRKSMLTNFQWFLRFFYNNEEKIIKLFPWLEGFIYSFFKRTFKRILKEEMPDVIVCTQAFPAVVAAEILENNKKIPIIYVLTDFDLFSYHIRKRIDAYLAPNESLKKKILKKHPNARIYSIGIPIDLKFNEVKDKEKLRKKHNLKNKKTVFVLGGGEGLGYIKEIVSLLYNLDLQIIVSAGRNTGLKNEIEKKFPKVKVFGLSPSIDEFYCASDLVITKPGGITTSELLATKIPMIITNPLPGVEERNSNYLVEHGVAIRIKELNELQKTVVDLLNDKKKVMRMRKNSENLSKSKAALDAAKIITRFIS